MFRHCSRPGGSSTLIRRVVSAQQEQRRQAQQLHRRSEFVSSRISNFSVILVQVGLYHSTQQPQFCAFPTKSLQQRNRRDETYKSHDGSGEKISTGDSRQGQHVDTVALTTLTNQRLRRKTLARVSRSANIKHPREQRGIDSTEKIKNPFYQVEQQLALGPKVLSEPRREPSSVLQTIGRSGTPRQKEQPYYPESVLVICHPGLERVLSLELTQLGVDHVPVKPTTRGIIKLLFDTSKKSAITETVSKCHLYLGSASYVVLELLGSSGRSDYSNVARALGELQRKVARLPWNEILNVERAVTPELDEKRNKREKSRKKRDDGNLPAAESSILCKLKVSASKSRLMHTEAIRERIVAGINDALKKKNSGTQVVLWSGAGSNDDQEGSDPQQLPIVVSLQAEMHYDRLRLWLDTSSIVVPMNRRGYRLALAKAPLREDLAYSMLYSAGWLPNYKVNKDEQNNNELPVTSETTMEVAKQPTFKQQYEAFLDPFCGSGTLAIEAAAMWAGLPPGRLHPPPLAGTQWYNPALWHRLLKNSPKVLSTSSGCKVRIACSDRDQGAVEAVQSNAQRAGVWELLETNAYSFSAHPWLQRKESNNSNDDRPRSLLIVTNPPYARRVSNSKQGMNRHEQLLPLFQTLTNRLEQLSRDEPCSLSAAILVSDENILKRASSPLLKWKSNLQFSHGGIFVTSMMLSTSTMNNKTASMTKDSPRGQHHTNDLGHNHLSVNEKTIKS